MRILQKRIDAFLHPSNINKKHKKVYSHRGQKGFTMANKYNAEGYYSPTEYEALTNIEKEERAAQIAANFRPIVYICSPYSGNVNHNIEMARKYSRFAVDKHYLPIAPHLLFTQFMNDEIPEEREMCRNVGVRRCYISRNAA